MDDGRKKAAALFGKEFMGALKGGKSPKQVNSAQALQKRANDRPIPVYKSGGPVKKSGGGRMNPEVTATPPPAMGPRAPGGMSADVNAGRTPTAREARALRAAERTASRNAANARETTVDWGGGRVTGTSASAPTRRLADAVADVASNRRPVRDTVADARSGAVTPEMRAQKKAALLAARAGETPGTPGYTATNRALYRGGLMAAGGAAKKRKGMCAKAEGGPIRIDLEKAKKDTKVRDEKREAEYRRKMGSQEEILKRSERNQAREESEEMPVRRAQGGSASQVRKERNATVAASRAAAAARKGPPPPVQPPTKGPLQPPPGKPWDEPAPPLKYAQGGAGKVRKGVIKGAVKTKKGIGGVM